MGLSLDRANASSAARWSTLELPPAAPTPLEAPALRRSGVKKQPRGVASVMFGFLKPALAAVLLGSTLLSALPATGFAQNALDPPRAEAVLKTPLATGMERLLRYDADHDGKVIGTRYGNELAEADPLSRAIYAFVDYANPGAKSSLWGPATAGDYLSGGLGVGAALRPQHMTANRVLLQEDLMLGLKQLEGRLSSPLGHDAVSADLGTVLATLPPSMSQGEKLAAIAAAGDHLLDHIKAETEKKELASSNSTALLTAAELLASLPAESLERTIAETTLGHGASFFAPRLAVIGAHYAKPGTTNEAEQHYLLVLTKRATEAKLIGEVKALLP